MDTKTKNEQKASSRFERETRAISVKRRLKKSDFVTLLIIIGFLGFLWLVYKKTDWELVRSIPTVEMAKKVSPFKKNWINKGTTVLDTEDQFQQYDVSPDIETVINKKASQFKLNPALIKAVIEQESGYQNHAIKYEASWEKEYSWKFPRKKSENPEMWKMNFHSIGLMQISYAIWKDFCGLESYTDLFDKSKNIECGAKILSTCLQSGKSKPQCIKEYNGQGEMAEQYKLKVLTRFARLSKVERKFVNLG